MAHPTPHFERDSSNNGWTLTKPDPLSIGTDRPMALVVRPGGKGSTRTADEHRWHKLWLLYLVVSRVN